MISTPVVRIEAVIVVPLGDVVKSLRALTQEELFVGIPDTTAGRREEAISNAALAYIHDKGSPAANIPARPFLEPGILSVREKLTERLEKVGDFALQGDALKAHQQLEAAGLIAQAAIRRKINEGIPPPLKPGTIQARRRAGFKGTKPLIRTGQLRNAINYIIRKKS